jgi:hypothetical protein
MTDSAQQRSTHSAIASAPLSGGQSILKWGALVLLITESISVGSGIVDAIRMSLGH